MDESTNPWAARRREYAAAGLGADDLAPDPFTMFRGWYDAAGELPEPNAMVLSTVSGEGVPSSRMVLLKGVDERGFVLFTNLRSRKGVELAANPWCSLLFPWHPLQRQVRVEGRAEQLPRAEVAAYFATRPRGAQLGAWASPQSQVVTAGELAERFAEAAEQMPDEVPPPGHWGGFVVVPSAVEFWQGKVNRMHDRWVYRRDVRDTPGHAAWVVERLAP